MPSTLLVATATEEQTRATSLAAPTQTIALPKLPPLPPDPSKEWYYARSAPTPSPDGKWLLYHETCERWLYDVAAVQRERWRLVRRDGGETHFAPTNGRFQRVNMASQHFFDTIRWLPDSSGWIARFVSEDSTGKRYRLSALDKPDILKLPTKDALRLIGATPQGALVWMTVPPKTLYFTSASQQIVHDFPGLAVIPNHPTGTPYFYVLSPKGDGLLLATSRTVPKPLPQRLVQPIKTMEVPELWYYPLPSGAPQHIATFTPDTRISSIAWLTDRSGIVCLTSAGAYLLTPPTTR